jgi:hypothetical protein
MTVTSTDFDCNVGARPSSPRWATEYHFVATLMAVHWTELFRHDEAWPLQSMVEGAGIATASS